MEKEANRIYYDHTLTDNKHYFGGFLNLAGNNISTVLDDFCERFHLEKKLPVADLINTCFANTVSDTEYVNRLAYLKQYFPVIHYLEKQNTEREFFRKNLILLLKTISKLRNFYTHYYHNSVEFEDELFELLDQLFLDTIRDVKKNKMKDDKTRHLLNKNLKSELEELYRIKKEKLEKDKSEGKKVSLLKADIENGILNDSFYHLLDKKGLVNKYYVAKQVKQSENTISISQSGLIFLLGMFLSKKESEDLRSRVKGFKGKVVRESDLNKSLKFMATHWVFSHLGYKGAKHRLSSSFDRETLLIQIIDELSKVPHEVYEALDHTTQKSFIEDINEYVKEGKRDFSLEESQVVHPVIRKRYEDRFHYLVLRYLDEFANFPTLRFQLHLGNYVHDRRVKQINGTKFETERVVKEKIKVFSTLSAIGKLKSDFVSDSNRQDGDFGWEVFPNPSYNFVGHNIPIFINLQKSEVSEAKPLFGKLQKSKSSYKNKNGRTEGKATKEQITKLIDNDINGVKFKNTYIGSPLAMLSLNELPALLFDLVIRKKPAKEIEDTMIEKLIARFNTIESYTPDQQLSTSKITKKLKKSTHEATVDIAKLIRAIDTEVAISCQKHKEIENNRAEFENVKHKRKYVFTTKELGVQATWLAYDLKRFMPKQDRQNLKGYQFTQLQYSLSKFDSNKNEVFELLKGIWDFDKTDLEWNASVKKVLTHSQSFDQLYEKYIVERKALLQKLRDNITRVKDDEELLQEFIIKKNVWTFFQQNLYMIDSQKEQISKLLNTALVFPRGIFDDKPTYIKGEKISESPELYADWYQYSYCASHQFQHFYALKRDYTELFEKALLQDVELKTNKKQLSSAEQLAVVQQKHDLKIKRVKTQDLFLKCIAEDVYNTLFGSNITMSLSDFYMTQKERLKKDRAAIQQKDKIKGDTSTNIVNDKFIWSTTIDYKNGQINDTDIKLKDIGKFKNYLKEEKVKTLLSYNTTKQWSKQMLDDELYLKVDSYEVIRRERVLKEIHEFEKYILEVNDFDGSTHLPEFEVRGKDDDEGHPNFKKYIANGILKKFGLCGREDIDWFLNLEKTHFEEITIETLRNKSEIILSSFLLVLIRNKFAHNQLPNEMYFTYIKGLKSENKYLTSSTILLNFFNAESAKLKNLMCRETSN